MIHFVWSNYSPVRKPSALRSSSFSAKHRQKFAWSGSCLSFQFHNFQSTPTGFLWKRRQNYSMGMDLWKMLQILNVPKPHSADLLTPIQRVDYKVALGWPCFILYNLFPKCIWSQNAFKIFFPPSKPMSHTLWEMPFWTCLALQFPMLLLQHHPSGISHINSQLSFKIQL